MWFKTFVSRLRGLFKGNAWRDRELRAEIDAHIAEATDEFTRQGMTRPMHVTPRSESSAA